MMYDCSLVDNGYDGSIGTSSPSSSRESVDARSVGSTGSGGNRRVHFVKFFQVFSDLIPNTVYGYMHVAPASILHPFFWVHHFGQNFQRESHLYV